MTEKITIPFGQFGPDQSQFNPEFIETAINVMPYSNWYGPFASFVASSSAVPGKPQGGFLADQGNGVWVPLVATADRIYKLDFVTRDWVDVSGSSAPYSTPIDAVWSFVQFGSLVVGTNTADKPVYFDLSNPTSTFEILSNDAPRAKGVTTAGDFLILYNLPDVSDKAIWWSGLNDPFDWIPNDNSSDFQIFPDDGEIMSIVGSEKGYTIFHENCIREGAISLEPQSPLIMTFSKVVEQHGTHARNSVVNTAAGTFYLSQDGFYLYRIGQQPVRVGVERVDEYFFDRCDQQATFMLYATEDPVRKVVYFAFKTTENQTDQSYDEIIVYNYGVDRFSVVRLDTPIHFIYNAVVPGYTLDSLNDTGYTLDTLPFSLDSRIWSGSLPVFAAFNADYELGFFSGTPMEATIQTADIPLTEGKRSFVRGFRPLCDAATVNGRVARAAFHGKALSWGPEYPLNTTIGLVPARSEGLIHRFEVTIPAGVSWTNILGVEADKTTAGER